LTAFIFTDHARPAAPPKLLVSPVCTANSVLLPFFPYLSVDLATTPAGKPHAGNKRGDFNSLGRPTPRPNSTNVLSRPEYTCAAVRCLKPPCCTLWKGRNGPCTVCHLVPRIYVASMRRVRVKPSWIHRHPPPPPPTLPRAAPSAGTSAATLELAFPARDTYARARATARRRAARSRWRTCVRELIASE